MKVNRNGVTRLVLLTERWAIKLPRFGYGWRFGLKGLLANLQEREFARCGWPELCPVRFSLPGGWLVVMPRATMLTDGEWAALDFESFRNKLPEYWVPVEEKRDSFGTLNGKIVAIDYG